VKINLDHQLIEARLLKAFDDKIERRFAPWYDKLLAEARAAIDLVVNKEIKKVVVAKLDQKTIDAIARQQLRDSVATSYSRQYYAAKKRAKKKRAKHK
jgi:hypothetical protein